MLAPMKTFKAEKGSPLEAAVALLLHNEAEFLATERETRRDLAQFSREIAKLDREMIEVKREAIEVNREADARFARIEKTLAEHGQLRQKHNELIEWLIDAIREKIGFKSKK